MKKKYISLPHGYLSYSQLALWRSNPKTYADLYFDDRSELRSSNRAMEYGKVVADALENGIQTGDLLTDSAMLLLPKYDTADQEMRVDMKTQGGWIPILAKPDTFDSVTKSFGEFKTGKVRWTQQRAQEHLQMHFYATAIYLKYKVVPPDVRLIWIETDQQDGVVTPTGHVEEFKLTIRLGDIIGTMAMISKAARDISIAFAAHVPNKELLEW